MKKPNDTITVFISYPSEARSTASEIYDLLEWLGVKAFFDKESLIAGEDWEARITAEISTADAVVRVYTASDQLRTGVIHQETRLIDDAQKRRPPNQIFQIPARTEKFTPPSEASKIHFIDLFEENWKLELSKSIHLTAVQNGAVTQAIEINTKIGYLSSDKDFDESTFVVDEEFFFAECSFPTFRHDNPYYIWVNSKISSEALEGFWSNARKEAQDLLEATGWKREQVKEQSTFNASISARCDDLISIEYYRYHQNPGAVHGTHARGGLNFWGKQFGNLRNDEIFDFSRADKCNLFQYVEAQIRAELLSGGNDLGSWRLSEWIGRKETAESIVGEYCVTDGGIKLLFSSYEVAAYAYGTPDVLIPWSYASHFLHEDIRPLLAHWLDEV